MGSQSDGLEIKTKNISALTLTLPSGRSQLPLDLDQPPLMKIDADELVAPKPLSDRSWVVHFRKVGGNWKLVASSGTTASCTSATACKDRSTTRSWTAS